MWKRFIAWWHSPKPMRVWLVEECNVWVKIVASERPKPLLDCKLLGPFRSEVDAEEAADHLNLGRCSKAKMYRKDSL